MTDTFAITTGIHLAIVLQDIESVKFRTAK